MRFINIPVFLISFAVGLFIVYVTSKENKTIVVFPTPENQDAIQFVDKANTCHRFVATEKRCPINKDNIVDYDIQV